jgi:hypothetical protein
MDLNNLLGDIDNGVETIKSLIMLSPDILDSFGVPEHRC